MLDQKETFDKYVGHYELLVSREDYQQNIAQALDQIVSLDGLNVIELGAGTGRLTCMLAPKVETILALDASPYMLDAAVGKLEKIGSRNWQIAVADHRNLPVSDQIADLVISGWSICYLVVWYAKTWQSEIQRALAEVKRVLRPDGVVIILETLGTGYETPHRPDELGAYYTFLEGEGFSLTWIRTDYRFKSLQEAKELTGLFFGEEQAREMVGKVIGQELAILPECTGIWWKRMQ